MERIPNARLRRARELRGWSQRYVAEQISAPSSYYVSRWERGVMLPSPHYREKLCRLFEMRADELGLLEIKEEHAPPSPPATRALDRAFADSQARIDDPAIPLSSTGIDDIIDREELIASFKQSLHTRSSVAFWGLPGVGKSTLAKYLLQDREVIDAFPDGVLWAGLGRQPNILDLFSRWGALFNIVPVETADMTSTRAWARVLHAAIGSRRFLIVIDDAWSIEDALAFKVGGSRCCHLLTTRFSTIAFQFADTGTSQIREFNATDAAQLLTRFSPHLLTEKPQLIHDLVRSVDGLPLALALMGRYLARQAYSHQPRRLHTAIANLRSAEARLQLAEPRSPIESAPSVPEHEPVSLQAAIGVSDQYLDADAQQALRSLSLFPAKPNIFSEAAALAVSNAPASVLDQLVDAGLLESCGQACYTLHQTIADYARVRRTDESTKIRMIQFFVDYVNEYQNDYRVLEQETANVLTAFELAYESGQYSALVQGINAFAPFLYHRGQYDVVARHLERAKQAASRPGDEQALARIWLHMGMVAQLRGDYSRADQCYQEGIRLARATQQSGMLSMLLAQWGEVAFLSGDHAQAEQRLQEGLSIARPAGPSRQTALLLKNLGEVVASSRETGRGTTIYEEGLEHARSIQDHELTSALLQDLGIMAHRRGDYEQAESYYEEGLKLASEIGHQRRICALLTSRGAMAFERQHFAQARENYEQGLRLARLMGNSLWIGRVLQNLGALEIQSGHYGQAETLLQESLALARAMNHRWLISETLCAYGDLYLARKQMEAAARAFQEALEIAQEIDAPELVALALYGAARAAAAQGNHEEARRLAQQSVQLYQELGDVRGDRVALWLKQQAERPPQGRSLH
jgi:tetratricopeptide (TPR) repeat protein/transcriptional regulator with XRE-family HTH domain